MDDLIEALQIFRRYRNSKHPTICEHDVLYVPGITFDEVSTSDRERLSALGFSFDEVWMSYRFGSA